MVFIYLCIHFIIVTNSIPIFIYSHYHYLFMDEINEVKVVTEFICDRCNKPKKKYSSGKCKSCYNHLHHNKENQKKHVDKWREKHKDYWKERYKTFKDIQLNQINKEDKVNGNT